MISRASLFLLLPLAAACYRYEPLTGNAPVVGTEVRSHLTPEGSQQLSTTLGRGISSFDARVLGDENNAWRMAVSRTRTAELREVSWTGEAVSVPKASINRYELKVLDRKRTMRAAVLGVLGGVAAGLIWKGIEGGASGNPGGGGGPPPA